MSKPKHQHHIDVSTHEELVTVTIGSDGGVPGGFAKLFNRVVDSEAWARLSDVARAAYVPMVRFADHRNQFRVQMGRSAMMKYTGLSLSSIKRAVKDLIANKLVVVIEQGGVSASGENESNVYQLLVPTEGRRKATDASMAAPAAPIAPAAGSAMNPPSVPSRTPSRTVGDPPAGPLVDRPSGRRSTLAPVHGAPPWGANAGPQLRKPVKENSKTAVAVSAATVAPAPPARLPAEEPATDAVALLIEKGVEAPVARQLAAAHDQARIVDVVATMEYRRARGKCDNPGGFIREALVKQWQTPRAVTDARARAQSRLRAQAIEQQARHAALREAAAVDHEEARIDRLIAALDEEELALLSQSVMARHAGNPAVIGVLTRKPPRQCRLMKMEIAAMLEG